jgi:hypothetical protein
MKADERKRRDPFGDNIVNEPRLIESAVESLNAEALSRVSARFHELSTQLVPRLGDAANAVVVLSPEPGYGKSHLIGRLFRRLDDEATLINVRPFQDASSCWISVLERVVTELNYPDEADKVALTPGDVTQLDTLARRVMVHLVRRLLEGATKLPKVKDPKRALAFLQKFPNAVFETPEWRSWLSKSFEGLLPALDAMLAKDGVHLKPSRSAWLKVLFKYAFSEHDPELRQSCLEWLRYEPLAPEDGARIGLRLAELPSADTPWELRNDCCFDRIRDLFQIAAYYRPFLMCFDQTELYGGTVELARSFGQVLSRLRRGAKNHVTVVTANEYIWNERLFRHFEKADQDSTDDPIHLDGIREAQARELLRARLEAWKTPKEEQEQFLDGWVSELFRGQMMRGVRHVLREASSRWSNPPPITPRALFEAYRQRLLADPKRLDFDSGVLQLVCETVLGPAAGVDVSPLRGGRGYLSMQWAAEDADVLLGFEAGSHWKTWDAIVREARRYREAREKSGRVARASFFRTSGQRPIPARSQAAIDDSKCVQIVALDRLDAASLYAAHDLYADVQQGNQDVPVDELLAFLREELAPQARRVLGRHGPAVDVPEPPCSGIDVTSQVRIEAICAALRTMRFATMDMLLERLKPTFPELTSDVVLDHCHEVPAVRVVTSPNSVVIRWIQSASA